MKRKILFRGKIEHENRWAYGSLVLTDDDKNQCFGQSIIKKFVQIAQYEAGDWNMGGWAFYNVIPETVGQFTEMQDVDGIDIYEGDILSICNGSINGMEWPEKDRIIVYEKGRHNVPLWSFDSTHYFKVVGNIF